MRYLTVNTNKNSIKKEIQQDLEKIIFTTSSKALMTSEKREISTNLETLVTELFETHDLKSLGEYLLPYMTQCQDELRMEVFNLYCFLAKMQASESAAGFDYLMDLLDQKSFFESSDAAIKAFGMLLNLQKNDMESRLNIFERLFKFVKANNSMVLYKYSFDIPSTIGPVKRELHLEVLDYAINISQMKDLWQDFGKLLLVQVNLFSESETLPESFNENLTKNLLLLLASIKGIFWIKNLELNPHVQKIIESSAQIKNLLEALMSTEESKLSEENKTPENSEKVQIVKLMNLVQTKSNWGLNELAEKVLGETDKSGGKKIQGLLMKCMKQKLLKAKINRKSNSVLVT
jgi:hypothetical protein